jgi:hypothetical protein
MILFLPASNIILLNKRIGDDDALVLGTSVVVGKDLRANGVRLMLSSPISF